MNEDVEILLKHWEDLYKKQTPSFSEFSKTIVIYKTKYKWQKLFPFWLLKLVVKPSTFYDCFPTQIKNLTNDTFEFNINFRGVK